MRINRIEIKSDKLENVEKCFIDFVKISTFEKKVTEFYSFITSEGRHLGAKVLKI